MSNYKTKVISEKAIAKYNRYRESIHEQEKTLIEENRFNGAGDIAITFNDCERYIR